MSGTGPRAITFLNRRGLDCGAVFACNCPGTIVGTGRAEMRLRTLNLREIHMRLLAPFETSFGKSELRRILLVKADAEGVSGCGRIDGGREDASYAYETVETAWHILRDHIWPHGARRGDRRGIGRFLTASLLFAGTTWPKRRWKRQIWDAGGQEQKNVPLAKLSGRGMRQEIRAAFRLGCNRAEGFDRQSGEASWRPATSGSRSRSSQAADVDAVRRLRNDFPHSADGGREFGLPLEDRRC